MSQCWSHCRQCEQGKWSNPAEKAADYPRPPALARPATSPCAGAGPSGAAALRDPAVLAGARNLPSTHYYPAARTP